MNEKQAIKALKAAIRKIRRAAIDAKDTYTVKNDDGSTMTDGTK